MKKKKQEMVHTYYIFNSAGLDKKEIELWLGRTRQEADNTSIKLMNYSMVFFFH